MQKVLTVVHSTNDNELIKKCSKLIKDYLLSLNITEVKKNSLNDQIAVDSFFNDPANACSYKGLRRRLSTYPVDYCLQNKAKRVKKILFSDMDGTLIVNETLNDLAKYLGKGDQVKELTALGMKGLLDFSTSLASRVHLLAGLKINSLEETKKNITLINGAKKLINTLKKKNMTSVLVTGGFKPVSTYLKNMLKIDYEYSNTFGIQGDEFTGKVIPPVVSAQYKATILKKIVTENNIDIEQTIAIGDAANDLSMLLEAGLGVAFMGTDVVKSTIDHQINYTDLTSVLYYLGISKKDFA